MEVTLFSFVNENTILLQEGPTIRKSFAIKMYAVALLLIQNFVIIEEVKRN